MSTLGTSAISKPLQQTEEAVQKGKRKFNTEKETLKSKTYDTALATLKKQKTDSEKIFKDKGSDNTKSKPTFTYEAVVLGPKKKTRFSTVVAAKESNGKQVIERIELPSSVPSQELETNDIEEDVGVIEANIGHGLEEKGKEGKAIIHYERSIARGSSLGEAFLGRLLVVRNKDRPKGFKLLQSSALKGNSIGQAYFGYCHFYGLGTVRNIDTAFTYFELSAKQDNKKGIIFRDMCLKRFDALGLKRPHPY